MSEREDSPLSETNRVLAASEQTVYNLWKRKDGWTLVKTLAREERIEFHGGKQDGWMQAEPPLHCNGWRLHRLIFRGR